MVVPLLLSITPVGLHVQSDKGRPEAFLDLAQASVIECGIDVSTVFEHRSRSFDRARERVVRNVIKVLPKKLLSTIEDVELDIGRHLNDKVN